MRQIALPIDALRPDAESSLIITDCNAAVVQALGDSVNWRGHCAILSGPSRSGKSLMARYFLANGGGNIINNADAANEEALFNAWNSTAQSGESLLLISELLPVDWDIALPDLRSRLGAAMHLEIALPDEELMRHLLEKHFQDRGTGLTPELLAYILRRIDRSYAALEKFAKDANILAMERGKPIGLALVKELL